MTTPNGWQGQNNPAQQNSGQQAPQGYPQQAPSSASAHHPAGPAGYGAPGQPYGAPQQPQQPARPKQPLDLGKIFTWSGLGVLAVAFILLVVSMIVTLVGTGEQADGSTYARGQVLLYTSIGVAVIGAAGYIGGLLQNLTAKLKNN
jgi:hypothetical protein